jgi:hypothetical protein
MRRNKLGKLYDRLSSEERFKLVVEAESRGDNKESGQLLWSAARCTYGQADPDYTNLVRASKDLTWAVCLDLLPRLAKMHMAKASSEVLHLACGAFAEDARVSYLRVRRQGAEVAWHKAGTEDDTLQETEEHNSDAEETLKHMATRMEWAAEGFAGLGQDLVLETAADARTLWEAFGNFCREGLGLEPKKLVGLWFEVALPELEELETLTEDVRLEQEEIEKHEALIEDGWRKLVEG